MPPYACCLSVKLAVVGCVVFQLFPFSLVADLNTLRPFQLKGSRKVSNALKHVRLVRQMQNFKRIKIFLKHPPSERGISVYELLYGQHPLFCNTANLRRTYSIL